MKKMLNLILVLVVAGCATAPKTHDFEKSKSFSVPKDEAWLNIIEFFTSNNVQIKTIEKDSGVIYAESGAFDQRFADCGDPGLTTPVQNSGEFNVFVRDRGTNTIEVVVNTNYRQVRRFGQYPPFVVICNSTGLLEQAVLASAGKSMDAFAAEPLPIQPSRGATEASSGLRKVGEPRVVPFQ